IGKLRADAANGLVSAAQRLLGDSAPGLRLSGLSRATFPTVDAAAISIVPGPAGTGYVATAGTDTLTSIDGTHWTFDYGERPLGHYGASAEHDLFWVEPRGQHDIDLTITSVTVHRSGVDVHLAWRYGPDPRWGDDGHFYAGDLLQVTSVTAGGTTLDGGTAATLDASGGTATGHLSGSLPTGYRLTILVTIVNEQGGAAVRAFTTIDSTFKLG
ncbi:MAG TPA: hypothetical protein VFW20_00535, partial [Candidatus Limnocylindrales bacterium]|nr:hypothetical protein [Candidatus Limnocylindrales bacterium]